MHEMNSMTMAKDTLTIAENDEDLARMAADKFYQLAQVAIKRSSKFTVVLSGGHTPSGLFSLLSRGRFKKEVPWNQVYFFWGDERNVSPDSSESNFRLAWETMLAPLAISNKNIHRFRTELGSPNRIAEDYESQIRSFFGLKEPRQGPRFDLVFLGLGEDGHTASLFPDGKPGISISQEDPDRLVIAPWVPHLREFRFSLTPTALNQSDHLIFLVAGVQKAEILDKVICRGSGDNASTEKYPAQIIRPVDGELIWLVDSHAAKYATKSSERRAS